MIMLAPTRSTCSDFLRLLFEFERVAGRRIEGVSRSLEPRVTSALATRIVVDPAQVGVLVADAINEELEVKRRPD